MGSVFVLYQFSLLIATVVSISVAIYAWRNRGTPGATSLSVLLVGETIWAGSAFIMTLPPVRGNLIGIFWSKMMVLGIPFTVIGAFFFVLEYTGRERFLTPRWIGILGVIPGITSLLALIKPDPLVWTFSGEIDPYSVSGLAYEFGPLFKIDILYIYLLLSFATFWMFKFALTSDALYRGQVFGIIIAFVVPWVGNALDLGGFVQYYWTAVTFAVAGIAFAYTIFWGDLLDISPIARRTVIERINSGMVVIDENDRIIDANPGAVSLFDRTRRSLLGSKAQTFFAWSDLRPESQTTTTEEIHINDTPVQVEISPLEDDLDRFVGYVVLLQDISQLKRRERQLREQNRQLDRFASVVSHDLRNPLTVISGNIERAQETQNIDYLENAQKGVERMEILIDDLLVLAREQGDNIECEPVSLSSMASEGWRTVETGEAKLIIDAPTTIEADRVRLRQILENLFRNAVEHGGDDVTVTVGLCQEANSIEGFYVADDGPGIPPEIRDNVLEDGVSTSENGTGLGLSIVQGSADSHGWEFSVGESDDGGARFDFRDITIVDRPDDLKTPSVE